LAFLNLASGTNPGNLLAVSRPSASRLSLVLGTLLALGSVVGLWWSAVRAERKIRDDNDAMLARYAAAYLGVVTPASPAGGYDLPRLVSVTNTITGSSFWPGGFQIVLGSVALVADTIDLLPLPDTVTRALAGGAPSVVTTHGRYRVVLVPFRGTPGQGPVGAAAAWNTLPARLISSRYGVGTLVALGGIVAALLAWRYDPRRVWRRVVTAMALGLLTLVAVGLGEGVWQTARESTALRLLTARTLLEIAATASGVKQARLPEIGDGLSVRELAQPVNRNDDVTDLDEADGPVAMVVAVTPRTRTGLELRMAPVEAGLGDLWWALVAWLGLGALGLSLGVRAAGLSAPGGLFHSAAAVAESPNDEGSRRT
jgi:hypothetical protein